MVRSSGHMNLKPVFLEEASTSVWLAGKLVPFWPIGFSLDSRTHVTMPLGISPFSQDRSAVGALESSYFHFLMLQSGNSL